MCVDGNRYGRKALTHGRMAGFVKSRSRKFYDTIQALTRTLEENTKSSAAKTDHSRDIRAEHVYKVLATFLQGTRHISTGYSPYVYRVLVTCLEGTRNMSTGYWPHVHRVLATCLQATRFTNQFDYQRTSLTEIHILRK
jgi:hypothetical protein